MFEMGFCVGFGLLIILFKCGWTIRLWLFSNPVKTDVTIFAVLMWLHWGTMGGTMAATIGALMVSLILSGGKKIYGYHRKGRYMRGMVDVSHHVRA